MEFNKPIDIRLSGGMRYNIGFDWLIVFLPIPSLVNKICKLTGDLFLEAIRRKFYRFVTVVPALSQRAEAIVNRDKQKQTAV